MTQCFYTGEKNEGTEFLYYMNEGIYGPFSCKLLGNSISAPSVHKVSRPPRFNPIHTLGKRQVVLHFTIEKCITPYALQKWGQSCFRLYIMEVFIHFLVFHIQLRFLKLFDRLRIRHRSCTICCQILLKMHFFSCLVHLIFYWKQD